MPHKYALLPSSVDDVSDNTATSCSTSEKPPSTTNTRGRRHRTLALTLAIAASLLLPLALLTMHPFSPTSPALASTCGPTVATAQHNNCTYEPMLRSWIPPLCYHPAPTQDYTPFDDRPWYYDHNLTQPITSAIDLDALRTGANLTAYTNTFHDEHCLYAWRKLALAVQHRWRWLDTKTMSLAHSEHCAKRIARFVFSVGYAVGEERFGHTSTAPIMVQGCVELPWGREGRWWKFG